MRFHLFCSFWTVLRRWFLRLMSLVAESVEFVSRKAMIASCFIGTERVGSLPSAFFGSSSKGNFLRLKIQHMGSSRKRRLTRRPLLKIALVVLQGRWSYSQFQSFGGNPSNGTSIEHQWVYWANPNLPFSRQRASQWVAQLHPVVDLTTD